MACEKKLYMRNTLRGAGLTRGAFGYTYTTNKLTPSPAPVNLGGLCSFTRSTHRWFELAREDYEILRSLIY